MEVALTGQNITKQQTATIVLVEPYGAARADQYTENQPMIQPEPHQDLTLLSCSVCLFCNCICGFAALMHSCEANTAHRRGDYAQYRSQNLDAKICIGMSVFFGITLWLIILFTSI